MGRHHFGLLLSALVLILYATAQPTKPETNGNQTQFERETNNFIKETYTKIFLNFVVELQALYTKVVRDLSDSQNQTALLKEHLAYIKLLLADLGKYDVNDTQELEKEFVKKVKPLSKMFYRYEKTELEQPAEVLLIADAFDKYGRQSLKNSFQGKLDDLVQQITNRLQSHFDGLSKEEGSKELHLYVLYDNFKHNGSPTQMLNIYIKFIFESFYFSKNE